MPRPHRISRTLIGALVVSLVFGMIFWLKNVSSTRAADEPPRRSPAPPPVIVAQPPPQVTQTPTLPVEQSATQPARTFASQNTPPAGGVLAEARAKRDSGDLLAARKILNNAVISGSLSAAEIEAVHSLLGEINQVVFFSPKRFSDDEFGGTYTVKSGELLRSIADRHEVPWELLARLNGISDPRKLRAGQTLKVVKGPFHAVVTKSRYTLDIYLGPPGERGALFVRSFRVGLGSDNSTPTGTWLVESHKKLKNPTYFSPRGEGVIDADDPKNPLGERWIGLTGIDGGAAGKESYGIHGTIEPQSIGTQASMGCIRMHNEDVELVFDMLIEGKSTVVIKD